MSFRDLERAWRCGDVPSNERLILIALASHRNEKTGGCFPSVATLAREVNTSKRNVERLIARLRKAGHIEIGKRATRSGRMVNSYRLVRLERSDGGGETPTDSSGDPVLTPTVGSSAPADPSVVTPTEWSGESGSRIRNSESRISAPKPQEIVQLPTKSKEHEKKESTAEFSREEALRICAEFATHRGPS